MCVAFYWTPALLTALKRETLQEKEKKKGTIEHGYEWRLE